MNILFNYRNIFKFSSSTIFSNINNNIYNLITTNINNFIEDIISKEDLVNHNLWNNNNDELTLDFVYNIVNINPTTNNIYKKIQLETFETLIISFLVKCLSINIKEYFYLIKKDL